MLFEKYNGTNEKEGKKRKQFLDILEKQFCLEVEDLIC